MPLYCWGTFAGCDDAGLADRVPCGGGWVTVRHSCVCTLQHHVKLQVSPHFIVLFHHFLTYCNGLGPFKHGHTQNRHVHLYDHCKLTFQQKKESSCSFRSCVPTRRLYSIIWYSFFLYFYFMFCFHRFKVKLMPGSTKRGKGRINNSISHTVKGFYRIGSFTCTCTYYCLSF